MRYRYKLLGKWMTKENVSIKAHNALHAIFGNRTPSEQIVFLKKLCDEYGRLNVVIYVTYKKAFNALFGDKASFGSMVEILSYWDLSSANKQKYTEKLSIVLRILNKDIKGGISIRKYKLN